MRLEPCKKRLLALVTIARSWKQPKYPRIEELSHEIVLYIDGYGEHYTDKSERRINKIITLI